MVLGLFVHKKKATTMKNTFREKTKTKQKNPEKAYSILYHVYFSHLWLCSYISQIWMQKKKENAIPMPQ